MRYYIIKNQHKINKPFTSTLEYNYVKSVKQDKQKYKFQKQTAVSLNP